MAKIWYVKEGSQPTHGGPDAELSLDQCIKLLAGFQIKYLGKAPPPFKSGRDNLTAYLEPQNVVIEVDSNEAAQNKSPFDKEGFYLVVDLTPNKARNILK